jgi:hypothetical protein
MAVGEAERKRAVEIGSEGRTSAWTEIVSLLSNPSPAVRRAAASAARKLMSISGDLRKAFCIPLYMAATRETREQVLQYELRALEMCVGMTDQMVADIKDIARNATHADYVRAAANDCAAAAEMAIREAESRRKHWCARCRRPVTKEESAAGIERYGKPYCRHCLDERILEERNFEADVVAAKQLRTTDDVAVQSRGEKRIGDWLSCKRIEYVYDERYRIAGDVSIRPDFYLPEFDLYIEYWGMQEQDYLARKSEKKFLYQRAGKKLISLDWRDLENIESVLEEKLSRYIRL